MSGLVVDTQAVPVGSSMDSKHKLDGFFNPRKLLILKSRESPRPHRDTICQIIGLVRAEPKALGLDDGSDRAA
jgi:hypothetical protein